MEVKKSPKADLENKKTLFLEIGLIATLLIVLAAFEWKTYEKTVGLLDDSTDAIIEEEMIPITREELAPPPPPEIRVPVASDEILIVDDDIKIDTELIINTEDDNRLGVEIVDYVQQTRQEEEIVEEEEVPFVMVEQKPKFQGGDENTFRQWVFSNLVYPESAKENGVQGRVMLNFLVDTDGSVKDVQIIRGIDPSLDREAVRIISASPKWEPGRQRDRPVKVRFLFPMLFELR